MCAAIAAACARPDHFPPTKPAIPHIRRVFWQQSLENTRSSWLRERR